MRIYTEVIFKWDDKQNKLVETSSKSFDYQGEMALCKTYWKTWDERWYDDMGHVYKARVKISDSKWYGSAPVRHMYISRSNDDGQTWDRVKEISAAHSWGTARDKFRQYAEKRSEGKEAFSSKESWEGWWLEKFGTGNNPSDNTMENKAYLQGREEHEAGEPLRQGSMVYTQEGEGLSEADYQALSDDDKTKYTFDAESETYQALAESYLTEQQTTDEARSVANKALQDYIDDWKKIVDVGKDDEFERDIKAATQVMEFGETPVISALKDFTKDIGRAEEAYTEDVERLTEEGGTYSEDIEAAELAKTEGLEETVSTREERLKGVREAYLGTPTSRGILRQAEAKTGAAGFAASGVGRTARDVLAAEIGEEARDVEETFIEGRGDIGSVFTEDISDIEKVKEDALEEYLRIRTEAREDLPGGWEATTTAYEEQKALYETGTEDITASAESALQTIQTNIELLIEQTRGYGATLESEMKEWSPWTETGGFAEEFAEMGWVGYGTGFDPTATAGLFDPTVEEHKYTPGEGLKLYDPQRWMGGAAVPSGPGERGQTDPGKQVEDQPLPWLKQ